MHIYYPPKATSEIPVIDLAGTLTGDGAAFANAAQEIHRACRETGFFYVINHGVDPTVIEAQFTAVKALFDLPPVEKEELSCRRSPTHAGYTGLLGSSLDSQDTAAEKAPADLNESYYLGAETPLGHKYADRQMRGFGHNRWPDSLPDFKPQTLIYYEAVRNLANRIMSLLASSLELPTDWFAPHFHTSMSALRMLKYPPQPTTALTNQMGAGAHTDWSGMTVLAQDEIGGLEVRNVQGDWIKAPPVPGAFVINLGDLMARWTNGIYSSNFHRVVNNSSRRDRYSIAFFHGPDPVSVIEPIPTCIDIDHPRLFETCTTIEHLDEMYRRSRAAA